MKPSNYWISGSGKTAQSALVDQVARACDYRVYGHSENCYYEHELNTVVHTNVLVPPELPTRRYECVLTIRRDVIVQVMEAWVDRNYKHVELDWANKRLAGLLDNIEQRVADLDSHTWHSRRVVHTEDFLRNPEGVLSSMGLEQCAPMAPNRTKQRPWLYLENYKELRQYLQDNNYNRFKQISDRLKQFLDK
jgi:hypothetical protein